MWQLSLLPEDCSFGRWMRICRDYDTLLMLLRIVSHAEPDNRFKVVAPREADFDKVQALRRRGVDVCYDMAAPIARPADDAQGRTWRSEAGMPG